MTDNSKTDNAMAGGCACGKVRFAAQVANDEAYLCHSRMPKQATSSVYDHVQTSPQAVVC